MHPVPALMLVLSLILSTLLISFSYNWMLTWMFLEINTIAVIPLMARTQSPRAVEATTKYFITQCVAAAMYLFASTTNIMLTGNWNIFEASEPLPVTIAVLGLALKLGLAPVHSWVPEVLQGIDLSAGLILSTLQKLAPLVVFFSLPNINPSLLLTLGLLSILVGGWGGLNQTQLRKILAYSSIAHMGWFVTILVLSPAVALQVLGIYLLMTTSVFLLFKLKLVHTIHALGTSWSKAPILALISPLLLLSLAGLPPLSGFAPKMMVLEKLSQHNLPLPAILMAMSALLSLYFYLRVAYAMGLTTYPAPISALAPWRPSLNNPLTIPLSVTAISAIMLLPLIPTMLVYFAR
uniref:NADH-ubiquinone oxidoreductase chain 2 n=1 Tax=Colistium nudipinnis TaxID=1156758 RepID=W5QKV6_9PLEU|nr:NADH dehydrogenase subunit 2 [Colistium nudipinnis]AFH09374.1 NADH dehydrogenase subunit 2 [Colistium nudipinnis]